MIYELIYTSAAQGLAPGSRGFCTVAATTGIPKALFDRLESLSGYRHQFAAGDPRNPAAISHLRVTCGGVTYHVLSRVADAGADYTQRSNKLAHRVAIPADELGPLGPTALALHPELFVKSWAGSPRHLEPRQLPAGSAAAPGPCRKWERAAGDAGWGGVLVQNAVGPQGQVVLLYAPQQDPLPLVHEALALLPIAAQWNTPFTTHFTRLPRDLTCPVRCILKGTPEEQAALQNKAGNLIDLTAKLGPPPASPFVEAARTGDACQLADHSLPVESAAVAVTRAERRERAATPPRRPVPPPVHLDPLAPVSEISVEGISPARGSRWPLVVAALVLVLLLAGGGVLATQMGFGGLVATPPPPVDPHPEQLPLEPKFDPAPFEQLKQALDGLQSELNQHLPRLTELEKTTAETRDAANQHLVTARASLTDHGSGQDQVTDRLASDASRLKSARQELKALQEQQRKIDQELRALAAEAEVAQQQQRGQSMAKYYYDEAQEQLVALRGLLTAPSDSLRTVEGTLEQAEQYWKETQQLVVAAQKTRQESHDAQAKAARALAGLLESAPEVLPLPALPAPGQAHDETALWKFQPAAFISSFDFQLENNRFADGTTFQLSRSAPAQSKWQLSRAVVDESHKVLAKAGEVAELTLDQKGLSFRWLVRASSEDSLLQFCRLQVIAGNGQRSCQFISPQLLQQDRWWLGASPWLFLAGSGDVPIDPFNPPSAPPLPRFAVKLPQSGTLKLVDQQFELSLNLENPSQVVSPALPIGPPESDLVLFVTLKAVSEGKGALVGFQIQRLKPKDAPAFDLQALRKDVKTARTTADGVLMTIEKYQQSIDEDNTSYNKQQEKLKVEKSQQGRKNLQDGIDIIEKRLAETAELKTEAEKRKQDHLSRFNELNGRRFAAFPGRQHRAGRRYLEWRARAAARQSYGERVSDHRDGGFQCP